jgi:UTP--glucose-1-phosphate uridylyltransferase
MQQIRKGVVPAAGLGTRLYPMTGIHPKEMLPVGGKPMIYYTVLEAALSGLEEIYVVINKYKDPLRQYLVGKSLIKDLREKAGKKGLRFPVITFVDQPSPRGSGEAIYRTKAVVGEEPFALMMPDRIVLGSPPALAQLITVYERFKSDILGILRVAQGQARGFGNVGILQVRQLAHGIVEVQGFSSKLRAPLLLEKGQTALKFAGRGIFMPHLFSYLEKIGPELEQWDDTPAIQAILRDKRVLGKILEATGFDVGNPIGFRSANEMINKQ